MAVHIENMDELKQKLAEAGDKLVVIDFMAAWCGPCKIISPKFQKFSEEYTNVIFCKVDVNECEDIAEEYNVKSMPTFVFIKNGKKIEEFSGADVDRLKNTIDKLL